MKRNPKSRFWSSWVRVFFAALLLFGAAAPLCRADDNALPFDQLPPGALDHRAEWRDDPNAHMVAIEALVVEVDEDKTRDLGFHYGVARDGLSKVVEGADILLGSPLTPVRVPTLTANPATGETSVGFSPRLPGLGINLVGMNVNGMVASARLRALMDRGHARITTRPVALALNGTPALIQVGSKVPYQDVSALGALQVAEGEVGVKLEVTPNILDLAQQIVELQISGVEVASLSNFITAQNINRPVISKADTHTRITMRAGETCQLSSLKGRRTKEVKSGVPVLKDIPLLGRLFSSREQVEEGVDIFFFITPHIVEPGQNVLVPYDFKNRAELVAQGVAFEDKK
ncbi:hypothetical protein HYR69_11625 [Candidatus Sumerlaeota bacterium]|nr:hypothetical protein [Candidatus Sumerlaeota bacterium]